MPTSSHFSWCPALLLALTALARPAAAQAPFYAAANVTNTTGTYTDLGTTGAAIATANTDDANSAATPIGFTFTYNGTAFTDFVLNTNGFVKLGTAAPTGAQFGDGGQSVSNGPLDGPDSNLLLPLNQDLGPGSAGGTEYRVLTTGAAPNRVCTIQWKNVSDKPRTTVGTQYANFSFQAKLYETSNQIDFVYGPATAGSPAADMVKVCIVGLKGSSATALVLGSKASTSAWSGTIFLDGPYTGNGHNVRGTVLPDPGRTYRFAAPVANDAAVAAVQAPTQLPIPQGAPHPVRALVANSGTTAQSNIQVTLTATGANTYTATQTIASLPLGPPAVVTFAGYTPTNPGPTTLTVSVPADGNNGNNSRSLAQLVNTSTYSFADPGVGARQGVGFGPTDPYNAGMVRLSTSTPLRVTQVRAYLRSAIAAPAPGATEGKTVFGVLFNAAGAVLARSADYVVTGRDLDTYVTFTLTNPPTLPAGSDLYVGLAQTYQPGQTTAYFPLGAQANGPVGQPNTFYGASTTQGGAPVDLTTLGLADKLMIEAVTQVVLGTRNAALAAQVGLYPNPAHGAFAVTVPAGPLGAATATLQNALGQVVRQCPLGLPAAGGTASFDVRGLAPGVYTLQLLSGETLVVKRVVLE